MDELDDYIKSLHSDPQRQKIFQAADSARGRGVDIPDDVVNEFYDATGHESGRSHFNPDGSVKRGGLAIGGERAIGWSQIMPGTAKPYEAEGLDPFKEPDNIQMGLREFYKGDPNDSIARRLAYVGGPANGALKQYRATGKISDARMYPSTSSNETYRDYVEKTGGLKSLDQYISNLTSGATTPNTIDDTSVDDYIKGLRPADQKPLAPVAPGPTNPTQMPSQLAPRSDAPVPETDATLEAQRQAARNDDSTRLATWYTPGANMPPVQPNEIDIKLPKGQGILRAYQGPKWQRLLQQNPNAVAEITNGTIDPVTLTGGKAEQHDKATGPAVVTRDTQGNELVSSAVSDVRNVDKEAQLQKQQFPNQPTVTGLENGTDVIAGRFLQAQPLTDANTDITGGRNAQVSTGPARQQSGQEARPQTGSGVGGLQPQGHGSEPVISDVPDEQKTEAVDSNNPYNAVAETFTFPEGTTQEQATKKITNTLQAKYGGDFSKHQFLNGYTGKPVQITYGSLADAGVDINPLLEQKKAEARVDQTGVPNGNPYSNAGSILQKIRGLSPEDVKQEDLEADPLYQEAKQNAPDDVDAEYMRLKVRASLKEKEAVENHEANGQFISNLIGAGGEGFNLEAGMIHLLNQFPNKSLIGDPSNPTFLQWAEREARSRGRQMTAVEKASDKRNEDSGLLNEYLTNPAEKMALSLPRFLALPGDIFAQLGADTFLKDVGAKGFVDQQTLAETGKSLAQAAVLHYAGPIGESYGKLPRAAAVGAGSAAVGLLTGEKSEDAFKNFAKMAVMDLGANIGSPESLVGRKFQATDGERSRLITVTPNGEVAELKDQSQTPDASLDLRPVIADARKKQETTSKPLTLNPKEAVEPGTKVQIDGKDGVVREDKGNTVIVDTVDPKTGSQGSIQIRKNKVTAIEPESSVTPNEPTTEVPKQAALLDTDEIPPTNEATNIPAPVTDNTAAEMPAEKPAAKTKEAVAPKTVEPSKTKQSTTRQVKEQPTEPPRVPVHTDVIEPPRSVSEKAKGETQTEKPLTDEPQISEEERLRKLKVKSLSQAVRELGGIKWSKYDKGEGKRISNRETGSSGLINNKSGSRAEDMAGSLWDFGYLHDVWPTRADINGNDLMGYIEDDVNGVHKHYSHEDEGTRLTDDYYQKQEDEYYQKNDRAEKSRAEYEQKQDELLTKQAGLLSDPEAQKVLAKVAEEGQYKTTPSTFTLGADPANEPTEQYYKLLEKHGISPDDHADSVLSAYREARKEPELQATGNPSEVESQGDNEGRREAAKSEALNSAGQSINPNYFVPGSAIAEFAPSGDRPESLKADDIFMWHGKRVRATNVHFLDNGLVSTVEGDALKGFSNVVDHPMKVFRDDLTAPETAFSIGEPNKQSKESTTKKPATAFDQVDLFGNKTTPKTEQPTMFGAEESSPDKDAISRTINDLKSKAGNADILRDVSAAKQVFNKAQQTKSSVADMLRQQTLDGKTLGERLTPRATEFVKAMEAGTFDEAVDKARIVTPEQTLSRPVKENIPAEPITDFGEKIGGARKDMWSGRGLSTDDLAKMTAREKVKLVKKDQIWPKPDYQEIYHRFESEGVPDPHAHAYAIKAVYDSIAQPNARFSEDDWNRYVDTVSKVRDKVGVLLEKPSANWNQNLAESIFGDDILYKSGRYVNPKSEYYPSLDIIGSTRFLNAIPHSEYSFRRYKSKAEAIDFPSKREAWMNKFAVIPAKDVAIGETFTYEKGERKNLYRPWAIAKGAGTVDLSNKPFESRAEAEAFKRDMEGKYILASARKHPELANGRYDVFDNEAAAIAKAKELYGGQRTGRRTDEPTRPQLEGIIREGIDYRQGKPATPESFGETFGFRGVEFGNWLNKADRQQSLDHAYDALRDLAGVLDVPPKALSLDGNLGLAFGARGKGGLNAGLAHYEPSKVVINLTKMEGAGSLAHEWGHAVDDYFGSLAAKGSYFTDPHKGFSSEMSRREGLRPEMQDAWRRVVSAIVEREASREETVEVARKTVEKQRGIWNSWVKHIFSKADAERMAVVQKGLNQAITDGVTVNSGPYGTFRADADKLQQLSKSDRRNLDQIASQVARSQVELQKATAGEMALKLPTDYKTHAANLDKLFRSKPYFNTTLELFARAFESYVQDRTENKSQYLVHGTKTATKMFPVDVMRSMENHAAGKSDEGNELPINMYPAGHERDFINAAFDDFVHTMEHETSDKGVMLKSVPRDTKQTEPFYSQLERTIEQKMPNKASADQVRGLLKDTKQEERDWLDIDGFLKEHPNPTKAELLDYVRANNADVQEVEKRSSPDDVPDFDQENGWRYSAFGDGMWKRTVNGRAYTIDASEGDGHFRVKVGNTELDPVPYERSDDIFEKAIEEIQDRPHLRPGAESETKFSQYTLPGGENYRELLLTLPPTVTKLDKLDWTSDDAGHWDARDVDGNVFEIIQRGKSFEVQKNGRGQAGLHSTFELAERTAMQSGARMESDKSYKSPHWNGPNVLAHVRFDDRDGGKTLHIAEIQSDWHQAGKKEGYKASPKAQAEAIKTINRLTPELSEADARLRTAHKRWREERDPQIETLYLDGKKMATIDVARGESFGFFMSRIDKKTWNDANLSRKDEVDFRGLKNNYSDHAVEGRWEIKRAATYSDHDRDLQKELADATKERSKIWNDLKDAEEIVKSIDSKKDVPDAPFKKSWPLMAFKRVLRHAAENGYERVTWDTGETSAERYDLSQHVDSVHYSAEDGRLWAIGPTGKTVIDQESVKPEDLEKYVGKEVAQKLVDAPIDADTHDRQTVEGDDLKVGGEGMKGFYDKILPAEVNKYVKKWGGKVEPSAVDTGIIATKKGLTPTEKKELRELGDSASDMEFSEFATEYRDITGLDITEDQFETLADLQRDPYRRAEALRGFIDGTNENLKEAAKGKVPVHSLPITPAMRESVMQGQPLFTKSPSLEALQSAHTEDILASQTGGELTGQNLHLSEADAESLRRLMGQQHFDRFGEEAPQSAFDGATFSPKQLRELIDLGQSRRRQFVDAGYTDEQLKGRDALFANLDKLLDANENHAVTYVYDEALPEEETHREDLDAGRTTTTAIDTLKQSPFWSHGGAFEEDYGHLNDADKTSEIAAKLATGQESKYGWDGIENFDEHKDKFLSTWADGIIEKNEDFIKKNGFDTFAKKYERIATYAKDTSNTETETTRSEGTDTAPASSGREARPPTAEQPVGDSGSASADTGEPAAIPGEAEQVKPKGEPSSIMNREVNAARENRGWEKLSPKLRVSNPELHDTVKAIIADDADAPLKTFEKFKEHPKAVPTDEENVLLNAHYLDVKREHNDMSRRYVKAMDGDDPLAMANAKMDRKVVDKKLDDVEQVLNRAGRASGKSLQSRQMFADEDFEYTTLERNFKIAKGREPSSEELKQLQQIADEHKAKSEALEAVLADRDQELADITASIPPRHILDIAENYVKKLHTLADKERARISAKGNVFQAGIDPRDFKSVAIIGADHLANMSLDFAKWSDKMVGEFGDKVKPHLNKIFDEAQKILKGDHAALKGDADKMSTTLKGQKTRMGKRIQELETAIRKKERITRTRTSLMPDAELENLREQVKSLKEDYDAIFPKEPRPPMTDAQRLQALEKRLAKKQQTIQEKVKNEDLSENPKRTPLDPLAVKQDTGGKYTTEDKARATRIIAAQAEVGKIEKRYARMKQTAERANEPLAKWTQRKLVNFVRGSMLSAVTVIEKLGTASIGRTVTRPIKTAIGYGVSKVIPGIARKAAIEGSKGLWNDIANETHAIAKAYTTGIMDMGRTLTGKGTDISNAYGKSENYLTSGRYLPVETSQLIGLMHDSLKSPAFRSEFEGVLGNLVLDAKRNGYPIDNETLFVLGQKAYDYAQRAKFAERRKITDFISNHILKPLDNNEITPIQAIGTFLHVLMPIHKIATNVIAQSFESSPLGLGKGISKAVAAKMRGVENLTPDQADIILRNIKHGTFGTAMYALGLFAGAEAIGSFYQKYDKDKDKEIAKYNTVQIDGYRFPAALLHLPEFNSMFMGATTKRIYEESLKKHAGETEAAVRGLGGGVRGLVADVPGVEAADALVNIYHAILGGEKEQMNESRYGMGNFVAGRTVPGIVRNTAEWFDQDPQGHFTTPFTREPYSRKVDTKTFGGSVTTQIQKNIPFWRNKLPNNTP